MPHSSYIAAIERLPAEIQTPLRAVGDEIQKQVMEIRLRCGQPLQLRGGHGTFYLSAGGAVSLAPRSDNLIVSRRLLSDCLRRICEDSVHSYERELAAGFLTLSGGHRVGIVGKAVVQDDSVTAIREISGMNLRIARQIEGAAAPLYPLLEQWGGILLAGEPGSGKTTVLRDLILAASTGKTGRRYTVSAVDEREEIGGARYGEPQFRLGETTDLLSGYPKAKGMEIALRAMSPDWIACDEIGNDDEAAQILQSMHSGVRVMATVHAGQREDLVSRPLIRRLLGAGVFSSVVFLGKNPPGRCVDLIELGKGELPHDLESLRLR